jgi:uncharacterized protein DUF748
MNRPRFWLLWLPLATIVLLIAGLLVAVSTPGILRAVALAQLRALTGLPTTLDSLSFDLRTGRIALRGLTVVDTDGAPMASVERVDARLRRRELLRGHVAFTTVAVERSSVRVVRDSHGEFNVSQILRRRQRGGGKMLDVTVDDFTLRDGTVVLEDRALSPWQTWRSDDLDVRGRNISTRRGDGVGDATSTINGAPVSAHVEQLRLFPVHLRAVVRARNVDVALARVYLPHDAPVTLQRGRLETTVTAMLDARQGIHVDADVAVTDAVAIRRYQRDPFFIAPLLHVTVRDFAASDRGLAVARVELTGSGTVQHGDVDPPARFALDRFQMSAEAVTWPVQAPARVALVSSVPGGGELRADGVVRLRPRQADLDVRLTGLKLEPWAHYVSPDARITGTGEAHLAVRASLEGGVTATARGTADVDRLVISERNRRLLALEHAEATGVEVGWPTRATIERVRLRRPSATLERDASGVIALPTRARKAQPTSDTQATDDLAPPPAAPSMPPVVIHEIVLEDGTLGWHDATISPAASLSLTAIQLSAQDVTWPLRQPSPFRLQLRSAGRGTLAVSGKASMEPLAADVSIRARGIDVAPYRPYLKLARDVGGSLSASIEASFARAPALTAHARGNVALVNAFVADGSRRVASLARAAVRGLDVDWPSRVTADAVTLRQPWVLVERDEHGGFPLRALLAPTGEGAPAPARGAEPDTGATDGASASPASSGPEDRPTIRIRRLAIEDGGARFADRSVSPPYVEDMSRAWGEITGIATAPAPAAAVQLRAVLGPSAALTLRGKAGPLGGPLFADVTAELRDFSIARVNPYLARFTAWTAEQGRLSTTVQCRIKGDELEVKDQLTLARLDVIRTAPDDISQRRLGVPLGLVVHLLKNSKGDIVLSVPIGGRLDDPRFDLHDTIWNAVRAATIKTIALPVSWIGRLRYTADVKIQDIEIDPVDFPAGSTELTRETTQRLARLVTFMQTVPTAPMIVTPAVSLGDIDALKTERVEARIKEIAKARSISEHDAAVRLFGERYPGRTPPENPDAMLRLLREMEPPPDDDAYRLAKRRADTVRDVLKKGDVNPDRIAINKEPEALETFDGGTVTFALADRIQPHRTLADLLRTLVEAFARRLAALRR